MDDKPKHPRSAGSLLCRLKIEMVYQVIIEGNKESG